MPELSIIVPVYKTEKYLPKCIDSILSQTFTDFELILIDDGSPDRCGEICDEYASKDSRITVIHQENKGVSAARNAGLDVASGTYIGFVDSDDWIESEMYEVMLSEKKRLRADILFCSYIMRSEEGTPLTTQKQREICFSDTDALLSSLFQKPLPTGGVCWNALIQKDMIGKTRFMEGLTMKEDITFLFDVFIRCRNGFMISKPLYNFRQQQESATRKSLPLALYNTLPANMVLIKRARAYGRRLEGLAVDKSIDDGIRFYRLVNKDTSLSDIIKQKSISSSIKRYIFRLLLMSGFRRLLSRQAFHGYIHEFIRM
ncbi:MAG: glycosyltransferase [Clostridia bacterium]|nr:glycosyltransferase [Clostridia bacterium]